MSSKWQKTKMLTSLMLCITPMTLPAAEPVVVNVPPYPASLASACASADPCKDALHSSHPITFISRISFPLGSAMLSRDGSNELLRMLVELESFAVVEHVEIIGHADPSGPENYNRWISEKRAKRVQGYFAQHGVDPRKVTLRGAGSSEPLVGAIDPSEHRRIEIRVAVRPYY